MDKNTFLIALCGKSGCGKSTVSHMLNKLYGWKSISSYTTRPPRYENEPDHIFISNEEFDRIPDDNMVAYTEFDGNRYCATTEQVENAQVYVIDPAGIETLKNRYHGTKKILVVQIDAPDKILEQRMRKRGDSWSKIADRLQHDRIAFRDVQYDFYIDTSNQPISQVTVQIAEYVNRYMAIDGWLKKIGMPALNPTEIDEYSTGQLLEAAKKLDCISDFDQWQYLQALCDTVIPLNIALQVCNMLHENDISVTDLHSEASDQYYTH